MRLMPQLALVLAGSLFAASAHADIALGQVVPLTGPDAAAGRAYAAGARAFIDKINAEGGIAGHKIIHVVRDNQGRADESVAQAAALIGQDHVFGLLPGAGAPASLEMVASGLLRQKQVPLLALRNAAARDGGPLASGEDGVSREAGLIEITPPVAGYTEIVNEYRATLAQYGHGEQYSSAGLQGYIGAKVMVGAVRLLVPAQPTHADYFGALRNMVPDVANRMVLSADLAH